MARFGRLETLPRRTVPIRNFSDEDAEDSQQPWGQIPQVPPQFKRTIDQAKAYKPMVVSLGPYHHGEVELGRSELFKQKLLDMFITDKPFFLAKIMQEIDEIRECYDADAVEKFSDEALAEMMLLDACFIAHHMSTVLQAGNMEAIDIMKSHFAASEMAVITRDLLLLENQIPLRFVKLLFMASTSNGGGRADEDIIWNHPLGRYTSCILRENFDQVPFWKDEPFHLLEIFRLAQLQVGGAKQDTVVAADTIDLDIVNYRFTYSATDLKAKGIKIKASDSGRISLNSYLTHDELEIVPWFVAHHTFLLFSNMIAYEITSATSDFTVTANVSFMKSLVKTADDVKELRAKGVLFNHLSGGDDEVVKMFKDLDTLGWEDK